MRSRVAESTGAARTISAVSLPPEAILVCASGLRIPQRPCPVEIEAQPPEVQNLEILPRTKVAAHVKCGISTPVLLLLPTVCPRLLLPPYVCSPLR
jgi:hypothetical protein